MSYEIDLSGHRALVTGAGQGVGEEIARTLAVAGAEVLVNDLVDERARRVVDGIVASGGRARPAVFDVNRCSSPLSSSTVQRFQIFGSSCSARTKTRRPPSGDQLGTAAYPGPLTRLTFVPSTLAM